MIRSLSRSCQAVEQKRACGEENINRDQRSLLNADACILLWDNTWWYRWVSGLNKIELARGQSELKRPHDEKVNVHCLMLMGWSRRLCWAGWSDPWLSDRGSMLDWRACIVSDLFWWIPGFFRHCLSPSLEWTPAGKRFSMVNLYPQMEMEMKSATYLVIHLSAEIPFDRMDYSQHGRDNEGTGSLCKWPGDSALKFYRTPCIWRSA
jgi:hypothetical protein